MQQKNLLVWNTVLGPWHQLNIYLLLSRCMSQKCQLLRQQGSHPHDALPLQRGAWRFPAGCASRRLLHEGQFDPVWHQELCWHSSFCSKTATEQKKWWFRVCFIFLQGHLREGKCHLSLGNAMAASRCFLKVLEMEPSNREAQQEVGITQMFHQFLRCKEGAKKFWSLFFYVSE